MKIAIIGAGNVGSALAIGWARAGHEIVLGVRNPSDPSVESLCGRTRAVVVTPFEAAQAGEVIVLALPWNAAEKAVPELGSLRGKIVIDCMNPLTVRDGVFSLERGFSTSAGETVAKWIPQARVVKTLNQVGADIMSDTSGLPAAPVMFMAGDDDSAKSTVADLLRDLGFEPLDAGSLSQARILEPFAMVWINQALARGKGPDWAFAVISKRADGKRRHFSRDSSADNQK